MPYTLNGQAVSLAEEPREGSGSVFVPFTQVVQALGGTVGWDNATKTATGTIGQWAATFSANSNAADVNGTAVQFSAPVFVYNDELYVPADFFKQAYGYTVTVNGTDVSIAA